MDWATFYGLCTITVCGLAWASRHCAMQKIALLLLFSWALSNAIHEWLNPPASLVSNAALDLVGLMAVTAIIFPGKKATWPLVFFLATYMLMLSAHLSAWISAPHNYYGYDALLNVVFLCQLLGTGGAAIVQIVGRLRRSTHSGLFHRGSHRAAGGKS